MSFHLQAEERFEELAHISLTSSAVALVLVLPVGFGLPIIVAACGMLVGELIGLIWMALLVFTQRKMGR